MSLAQTAAPFDENIDSLTKFTDTPVAAKRQTISHNRTQKRNPMDDTINTKKVNSVLESIHKNTYTDENNNLMGDFKPLAKPISVGGLRTNQENNTQESMTNLSPNAHANIPQPIQNDDIDLQNLDSSFMNEEQVQQYYKSLGQNQRPKNNTNHNTNHNQYRNVTPDNQSQQVLIDKLNYMINLLEEQQDEKTNNVTEEVVLYSFLGIFIIFIVDSFARVGKYVR